MKRFGLIPVLVFLFTFYTVHAQVAINNNGDGPDESAMMDIRSADKGLLVPRMVITDLDSDQTPVENPADGFPNVARWMVSHGYSDADIQQVIGGNVLRVLKDVWWD